MTLAESQHRKKPYYSTSLCKLLLQELTQNIYSKFSATIYEIYSGVCFRAGM